MLVEWLKSGAEFDREFGMNWGENDDPKGRPWKKWRALARSTTHANPPRQTVMKGQRVEERELMMIMQF